MGLDTVTAWVVVRRFDEKVADDVAAEELTYPPIALKLKQSSNFNELNAEIRSLLDLPENGIVLKLRTLDECLITLACLLEGNTEQNPFLLDVVRIHQHVTALQRSSIFSVYAEYVHSKINALEQRVKQIEALVPDYQSRSEALLEQAMQELSSKVSFLDRRLDELAPVEWRAQIQQAAAEMPSQKT